MNPVETMQFFDIESLRCCFVDDWDGWTTAILRHIVCMSYRVDHRYVGYYVAVILMIGVAGPPPLPIKSSYVIPTGTLALPVAAS